MVTASSNKKSDDNDDVDTLARRLFIAIVKLDYSKIEKLVKTGRNKGLLNVKEKEDNTFIHLVADVIDQRRYSGNIPDIGDSAPLIQDVVYNYHILLVLIRVKNK